MKRKLPKVTYKKLRKVWGWSDNIKNTIELSDQLNGKKHLEILIHEHLHLLLIPYDEDHIKEMAKEMSSLITREGYKKI
jgi:hypothetical protein